MATINLGAIKFNWKGAYNSGTAYAVDDVVSSGGSSYVCILASTGNATSNGTYWEQMSSAGTNGTNGTDVGTTITTQGDILYRDGSGLQRLGAGTSGQYLKTQGTGANPIWGTLSPASIVSVGFAENSTRYVLSGAANSGAWITASFTKTLSATASKVIVVGQIQGYGSSADFEGSYFDIQTTGMTCHDTNDSAAFKGVNKSTAYSSGTAGQISILQEWEDTTHFSAGTHTWEYGWRTRNGAGSNKPFVLLNPDSADDGRMHQTSSTFTFYEVLR